MATITATVLKVNKKKDGSYSVKFRLTHNRQIRYLKTKYTASPHDVNKNGELKTDFIIDYLASDLKKYRSELNNIENIDSLSVDDVKNILLHGSNDINLLPFFKDHIEKLKGQGRSNTAKPFLTVYNYLTDYRGSALFASKLTSNFLKEYEQYLRTPKTISRNVAGGKEIIKNNVYLTDNGVNNHMAALRTLFNEAKSTFNDEDTGRIVIKNNPFSKYKIKPKKQSIHKSISVEEVRMIRDVIPETKREEVGKLMFMLSFYLCGMNAVDIYTNIETLKTIPNRINYNRAKTKGKRADNAFISIFIPEEAKDIIRKIDINYSTMHVLNTSLSIGLSSLNKRLNIEGLIMYSARHSFATIARNDLRINKDDIAMALNHVDSGNKVTDIYIKPDWSIIDDVQRAVINKLNEDL